MTTQVAARGRGEGRPIGALVRGGHLILYLIAIVASIIVLIPFLWAVSQSFTPESQIFSGSIQLIPANPTIDNYVTLFFNEPDVHIVRWFFNSIFVSVSVTALTLLVDSMAAFALSRLNFPGRNILFVIFISTLLIPSQVTFIPVYVEMQKLGFLDSYNALIWPPLAGAFGLFLLRQFYQTIPRELEEAATIDGARTFTIYWRIILPLTRASLAAVAIFTFTASWNDLFWPLVTINTETLRTLPVGLTILNGEYGGTPGPALIMASAVVVFVPVLVVYAIFQRSIVEGISLTGLAGR